MSFTIEIEDNIELVNTRGDGRKYAAVQTMKQGQSFFVPEGVAKKEGTLRSQVGKEARDANLSVAVRRDEKVIDGETIKGYRVFCKGIKTVV